MNTLAITLCVAFSCVILQVHGESAAVEAQEDVAVIASKDAGHVYLLSEHDHTGKKTGYYKIGQTKQDVHKRVSDLQGTCMY